MKRYLFAATCLCGVLPAAVAWAQQDAAAIEEVIVTAQRRQEALQDVPLAVSAMSGSELQARGLTDMRDVLALTPGASFTFINAAEPVLSVRGISSGGEGAASDSGVLMMIDGEVISRDFMRAAPIFDVDRVEVLRGPQGTTYGRNATGGVFHVVSRAPRNDNSGEVAVEIGDYGAFTFNAAGDLRLDDATSVRLALHYQDRQGYSTDVVTGRDVDHRNSLAGRLTLRRDFQGGGATTLRIHGSRERHGDTGPWKSYDPTQPLLGPPFRPTYTEPSTDPYEIVTTPGGSFFDRDIWGVSNTLDLPLGGVNLTAITAFRRGDNHFFQGSPIGFNIVDVINKSDTFSQELRLQGEAFDAAFYWVVGGFYLDEDVAFGYDRTGSASTAFGPTTQRLRQTSRGRGYGLFAEGVWQVTPAFKVTAGGRYSWDRKSFEVDNRAQGPFAPFFIDDPSSPVIAAVRDSWREPTGRISLEYRFQPELMVYGTVSQGYKSGGFNPEPANLVAATTAFDEEKVVNYEVGVRSQLLEDRLRLNVTAFEMVYTDIQTGSFTAGGVEVIDNIGKATIRGVEVEAVARPHRRVQISAAYAAYDGTYDEFFDEDGVDLSGISVAKMPDWTLTLSAQVTSPLIADAGRLNLRLDYATRSEIAHDAPRDDVFGIRPGKDLVDLRLAWEPDVGDWEAALFVRNLLDEAEIQYVGPQVILSQRPVIYGPPRTFGVSLSSRF